MYSFSSLLQHNVLFMNLRMQKLYPVIKQKCVTHLASLENAAKMENACA